MKKSIFTLILTFCVSILFAQYTPMTAAGYQFKRIVVDSTLHLPSFCGVPTLRNSVAKNGAIALDTCNQKVYFWTNIGGWQEVAGSTFDSTSLSNRINLKLNISDTSSMLSKYLRKTDTGSLSNRINLKLNISDTATMLSKYLRKTDTATLSNRINLKLNISDTATMLSKYLRKTDTATLSNRINLKLNISDTATMLSKYLRKTDTASLSNRINLKLNLSDTASMLSKYLRKTDTTNKWITNIVKKNDSTFTFYKGTNATDISLASGGSGGSQDLQSVTDIGNSTTNTLNLNATTECIKTNGVLNTGINNSIFGYSTYANSGEYYPIYDTSENHVFYIKTLESISGKGFNIHYNNAGIYPYENFNANAYSIFYGNGLTSSISLLNQSLHPGTLEQLYYPDPDGNNVDTIATLADIRGVSGSTQNGRFGNDTATVVMAQIHNNSGATLTNGKVVFLATSGTNSDAPSVRLANNKNDSTSANTFGFVSGTIANNDTGWVILSGKIEKLNTSAFSNGDIIYLDSVSGNYTKTKPVAPYHMVYLGVVVKANNGNGSIFVKCQNGYELDEIHDVLISGKVNNNILVYSDTQKVWKNRSIYNVVDTTNTIATKTNLNTKQTIDTSTYYLLSDFNTTSTTAANTNLTFNMAANEVRRIMINGTCSKATSSTGLRLAIGAPTGATIKATQNASSNAINTSAISVISAVNTLGATINTAIATEMPFRIEGIITNGSNAGAVTLQVATVTSNTATIYAGTILSVSKVKGL